MAETIALEALTWLITNDELLPVFLGSTGIDGSELKARAGDPELLGAVLDFLTMDDAWVTQFCDAHRHSYDVPVRARAALPGGDLPHWT